MSLHPQTRIGAVRLGVMDLDAMRDFYERVVGLRTLTAEEGLAVLGVDDGAPLVELIADATAPRPPGTTGLFHLAILLPTKLDLAVALTRIATAGWPLTGASDHLVSEAIYLRDPEGNGIEIYRDRRREQWRSVGGEVEMATLPLDLDSVLAELAGEDVGEVGMPPGATIGHVHLQVADIAGAEAFYAGELGFDVTVRGYPAALFLSAGGYHHHVGVNTWQSAGAGPAPDGATGLRWFEVLEPDGAEERMLRDPSGNAVMLRPAPA